MRSAVAVLILGVVACAGSAPPGGSARSDGGGEVDASVVAPVIDSAKPDVSVDVAADVSVARDAVDVAADVFAARDAVDVRDAAPTGDAAVDALAPDAVSDRPPTDTGDGATPPPDRGASCSPSPDPQGFYASCAACPDPTDCDTIDVNGSRRYACGCGGGCPCSLRCGSYRIPGSAVVIGNICVR